MTDKTINKLTRADVEKFKFDVTLNPASADDNALNEYQLAATKSAIYPGQGTPLGLVYCSLKLNGEAGELAEHVGKALRDDGLIEMRGSVSPYGRECVFNGLTTTRRDLIIKEVGDVLWYLSAICNELGISLAEAALINLEKLCDRSERDALRGSGDER